MNLAITSPRGVARDAEKREAHADGKILRVLGLK